MTNSSVYILGIMTLQQTDTLTQTLVSVPPRFCGNRRQWDCRGASHLEDLHQRLSEIMIRRLKVHVLPQLPPKIRQRIPFDLPKDAAKVTDGQTGRQTETHTHADKRLDGRTDPSRQRGDGVLNILKISHHYHISLSHTSPPSLSCSPILLLGNSIQFTLIIILSPIAIWFLFQSCPFLFISKVAFHSDQH